MRSIGSGSTLHLPAASSTFSLQEFKGLSHVLRYTASKQEKMERSMLTGDCLIFSMRVPSFRPRSERNRQAARLRKSYPDESARVWGGAPGRTAQRTAGGRRFRRSLFTSSGLTGDSRRHTGCPGSYCKGSGLNGNNPSSGDTQNQFPQTTTIGMLGQDLTMSDS